MKASIQNQESHPRGVISENISAAATVSLVVPAWNEAVHIEATVLALLEAGAAVRGAQGFNTEVVVVDDGSDDDTAERARRAGARVVASGHRNIGATRNVGAAATAGRIIGFVDADTILPGDTLVALIHAIEKGAALAAPRLTMPGIHARASRMFIGLILFVLARFGVIPGCCLVMRREVFDAVGGFDEQWFASEEVWLVRAIRKLRRGKIVKLKQPVMTSPRKANAVSSWRLMVQTFAIALGGPRRFRDRARLGFWYER